MFTISLNHSLDLTVADSISSIDDFFQIITNLDKVYSTYSQSSKLQRELNPIAKEFDDVLKETSVKYSSFWTVKAIVAEFRSVNQHFSKLSVGKSSNGTVFKGLANDLSTSLYRIYQLRMAVTADWTFGSASEEEEEKERGDYSTFYHARFSSTIRIVISEVFSSLDGAGESWMVEEAGVPGENHRSLREKLEDRKRISKKLWDWLGFEPTLSATEVYWLSALPLSHAGAHT